MGAEAQGVIRTHRTWYCTTRYRASERSTRLVSIVTKVVVPIPAVVSTTATVGNLVWSKDPEELSKMNEARLRALGAPEKPPQRS